MKKCLALLCAVLLLLCAPGAMAEDEQLMITLEAYELEQATGTEVRLHLLLLKTGSPAYELYGLNVELYDASGAIVEVEQAEQPVFPMADIPGGTHYLPITLRFTLAQPGEVKDFAIRGVSGTQIPASGVTEHGSGVPWLSQLRGDEVLVTAWLPLDGGAAEDCFVTLVAVDEKRGYLGNGELPAGAARYVSGGEIRALVRQSSGLTDAQLDEMGYVFDAEGYAFFEQVAQPYLLDVPADFIACGYHRRQQSAAVPLARLVDRVDMHDDGTFSIHGCMEATGEGLWELVSIDSLTLIAADGRELEVTGFSYDMPYQVIGSGEILPYMLQGRLEEPFPAVDFRIGYGVMRAEARTFGVVEGGGLIPGVDGQGRVTLEASIPLQEGVLPQDCFVCVMFLDMANDVYQGAVWTYPGEAWLQDGVIRLPEMSAPETCTPDAAMVTMYCVAK